MQKLDLTLAKGNHDINVGPWGPFSKQYEGAALALNKKKGRLLQLAVSLALTNPLKRIHLDAQRGYGGSQHYVLRDNPIHTWQAACDYSFWSYRITIEGLSKKYAYVEFVPIDKDTLTIALRFINETDKEAVFAADLGISEDIHKPELHLNLKQHEMWIPMWKCKKISSYRKTINEGLACCVTHKKFTYDGLALGWAFGCWQGDEVRYNLHLKSEMPDACIYFRYIKYGPVSPDWELAIAGIKRRFNIPRNAGDGIFWGRYFDEWDDWGYLQLPIGNLPAGEHIVTLRPVNPPDNDTSQITFDGMLLRGGTRDMKKEPLVTWQKAPGFYNFHISNECGVLEDKRIDYNKFFALACSERNVSFSKIANDYLFDGIDELDKRGDFSPGFQGDSRNVWLGAHAREITAAPHSHRDLYFVVSRGADVKSASEKALTFVRRAPEIVKERKAACRKKIFRTVHPEYRDSQEHMMAQLLTNIIFPVNVGEDNYRKMYVGGKAWGGCYESWDGGFIGLGLLEADVNLAVQNLNSYLAEEDDPLPFVFFGTILPVQVYLYWEIYQVSQDEPFLSFFYPKIRRFYEFISGRSRRSFFDEFKDGCLNPFRYTYNSAGWDDYPAQRYAEKKGLSAKAGTVANTAHALRAAKLLRNAACVLGKKKDIDILSNDIEYFTYALESFMWDDATGYYAWVVREGNRKRQMLWKDKINANMGLGGLSPLVAGVENEKRVRRMLDHLKDPKRIWSDIGLSTVDMSAPYFSNDGYWNGRVWMAHQWFFWKAILSYGEVDFARQIAKRALEVWAREHAANFDCYENFIIRTEEGSGWPRFSSLSSPVLSFYSAYFIKGRITAPFDIIIRKKDYDCAREILRLKLEAPFTQKRLPLLMVLEPQSKYRLTGTGIAEEELKTDENGYTYAEIAFKGDSKEIVINRA